MDHDLLNHINKCRFCLGSLYSNENSVEINEDLEWKFFELIRIQLLPSTNYSRVICEVCDRRIKEFAEFQNKLYDVQMRLYRLVEKDQDDEESWKNESSSYNPEIFEPTTDVLDIKPEQVVVKMEAEDPECSEENYNNESGGMWRSSFDDHSSGSGNEFEVPVRSRREKKMNMDFMSDPNQQVPSGYKLCPFCAKVLKTHSMYTHIRKHKNEMTNRYYGCDICGYRNYRKRLLVQHMLNHMQRERTKEHQCRYCPEMFVTTHAKRHHERRFHEEVGRKFVCECGKSYNSTAGLYNHKKDVHEQGEFPCPNCGEVFTSKVKLKLHSDRLHAPKKTCEVCGKLVPPGNLFIKHMYRHGPRVKCPVDGCDKAFADKSWLSYHVKSEHGPQEKFNCPTCNAEFNTKRNLKRHIERQHESVSVPCQVPGCNYSTTRRANLAVHYKNHRDIDTNFRNEMLLQLKSIKMAA